MTRHAYERWQLSIDVPCDGTVPATATVRHVLKHLWRVWHLRCRGFSEDQELVRLRAENERLRETIAVWTARKQEDMHPC